MFNAMAAGWQNVFQVVQKDYICLSQFPTLRTLCLVCLSSVYVTLKFDIQNKGGLRELFC